MRQSTQCVSIGQKRLEAFEAKTLIRHLGHLSNLTDAQFRLTHLSDKGMRSDNFTSRKKLEEKETALKAMKLVRGF